MGEKEVEMKIRVSVPVAGGQSLYEEVKERSAPSSLRPKVVQSQNQKMNILLPVPVMIKAFVNP